MKTIKVSTKTNLLAVLHEGLKDTLTLQLTRGKEVVLLSKDRFETINKPFRSLVNNEIAAINAMQGTNDARRLIEKRMTYIGATSVSAKPELFSADNFPSDDKINGAIEHLNRKVNERETKMIKFDLKRALAGDALIDRKGEEKTGFHLDDITCDTYPYRAKSIADRKSLVYTEEGRHRAREVDSEHDLFMKYEATKQENIMDEESDQQKVSNIGNIIHNLSCSMPDEDQDEFGCYASYLWDLSVRLGAPKPPFHENMRCVLNPTTKQENTMIPFDLERALAGDKVLTIDGNDVTQLTRFVSDDDNFSLYGVVGGNVETWNDLGEFCYGDKHSNSLHMAPTPLSGWINIYPSDFMPSAIHKTKDLADEHAKCTRRLGCIDLSQHNEGEGL